MTSFQRELQFIGLGGVAFPMPVHQSHLEVDFRLRAAGCMGALDDIVRLFQIGHAGIVLIQHAPMNRRQPPPGSEIVGMIMDRAFAFR